MFWADHIDISAKTEAPIGNVSSWMESHLNQLQPLRFSSILENRVQQQAGVIYYGSFRTWTKTLAVTSQLGIPSPHIHSCTRGCRSKTSTFSILICVLSYCSNTIKSNNKTEVCLAERTSSTIGKTSESVGTLYYYTISKSSIWTIPPPCET